MNPNIIALRRAAALMGPDKVGVAPEPPAKAGSPQDTPAGVSHQATQKSPDALAAAASEAPPADAPDAPAADAEQAVSQHVTRKRGRPRGGIREAARLAGVPESYYRRHMDKFVPPEIARLAGHLAPCVKFSPAAWLKIMRCETQLERLHTIKQLARATRQPRPPTPTERLKSRIRELERENQHLRNTAQAYESGRLKPPERLRISTMPTAQSFVSWPGNSKRDDFPSSDAKKEQPDDAP